MKPLDNDDLKRILGSKKLNEDPSDYQHLWGGIEKGLPPNHSYYTWLSLLIGLGLVAGISIYYYLAKTDAPTITARTERTTKIFHKETSSTHPTPMSDSKTTIEIPKIAIDFRQPNTVNSDSHSEKEVLGKPQSNEMHLRNKLTGKRLKSKPIDLSIGKIQGSEILPAGFTALLSKEVPSKTLQQNYLAFTPYFTFHTMDPFHYDEVKIASDETFQPSPVDRLGMILRYGSTRVLTKRIQLSGTAGINFHQSTMRFRISDWEETVVSLSNRRVDLDLGLSPELIVKGFTNYKESVVVGISSRIPIVKNNEENHLSYPDFILGYHFWYQIRVSNVSIGPYYSSFIRTPHYPSYGRIKPNSYGFTIRFYN